MLHTQTLTPQTLGLIQALQFEFYKTKYQQDDGLMILRSLVYFDDVDLAEWPRLFRETTLTFGQVKKRIIDAVKPLL